MNALALPLTVADIIDEYAAKDAVIEHEITALKEAHKRLNMAATVQGTYVERVADEPGLYADTLRKNLLKSGWRTVYNRLQIDALASANDKKLFDRALADPPPLTMDTAKATFGDYLIRPRFHILRASGSALRNYSMAATRAAIFAAVAEAFMDAMRTGDELSTLTKDTDA